jgi:hypothetical protein
MLLKSLEEEPGVLECAPLQRDHQCFSECELKGSSQMGEEGASLNLAVQLGLIR